LYEEKDSLPIEAIGAGFSGLWLCWPVTRNPSDSYHGHRRRTVYYRSCQGTRVSQNTSRLLDFQTGSRGLCEAVSVVTLVGVKDAHRRLKVFRVWTSLLTASGEGF
jgi:hypothetical protein